MNLGVGGRGMAMSGAQVASVNDVNAAFWNPAGLNWIQTDFQVGAMHSEYFSSIAKFDYCLPPEEFNYFDFPDSEKTA